MKEHTYIHASPAGDNVVFFRLQDLVAIEVNNAKGNESKGINVTFIFSNRTDTRHLQKVEVEYLFEGIKDAFKLRNFTQKHLAKTIALYYLDNSQLLQDVVDTAMEHILINFRKEQK